jgi:hypothetical protein
MRIAALSAADSDCPIMSTQNAIMTTSDAASVNHVLSDRLDALAINEKTHGKDGPATAVTQKVDQSATPLSMVANTGSSRSTPDSYMTGRKLVDADGRARSAEHRTCSNRDSYRNFFRAALCRAAREAHAKERVPPPPGILAGGASTIGTVVVLLRISSTCQPYQCIG